MPNIDQSQDQHPRSWLNDREIADIVGWDTKDVAAIRAKYADQARVVEAIGERLARAAIG